MAQWLKAPAAENELTFIPWQPTWREEASASCALTATCHGSNDWLQYNSLSCLEFLNLKG